MCSFYLLITVMCTLIFVYLAAGGQFLPRGLLIDFTCSFVHCFFLLNFLIYQLHLSFYALHRLFQAS